VSFSRTSDTGEYPIGYCALEYSARDDEPLSSNIEKVILIVARQASGELLIRVHPNWQGIANTADHAYLKSTLNDVEERAHLDPGSLIKQLSTLSVGPLRTYDAGPTLAARPDLLQLYVSFMEL
jgi:hypothetical protein